MICTYKYPVETESSSLESKLPWLEPFGWILSFAAWVHLLPLNSCTPSRERVFFRNGYEADDSALSESACYDLGRSDKKLMKQNQRQQGIQDLFYHSYKIARLGKPPYV